MIMNRNNESFAGLPHLDRERSSFPFKSGLHTTFNAGDLIPIYYEDVLPGDTWSGNVASSIRMSAPLFPTMDNCYLDTYFFFVPNRLAWNRWKEFCGENPRSNWTNEMEAFNMPHVLWNKENEPDIDVSESGVIRSWSSASKNPSGSLLDYFGLPILNMKDMRTNDSPVSNNPEFTNHFSMLPFEAYNLIWNNFFRDQNNQEPIPLRLQNTDITDLHSVDGFYMESNAQIFNARTSYLAVKRACKMHDYFTSALPQPQKGPAVALPGFGDFYPVFATDTNHEKFSDNRTMNMVFNGSSLAPNTGYNMALASSSNSFKALVAESRSSSDQPFNAEPVNLWTKLSITHMPDINDLRYAFAIQRLLETDARGGNLYGDMLYAHFGVDNPDARLQLPEYLGGSRTMINMDQVVQTSETNNTPQGNVSGLSLTNSVDSGFTKSFTEFGMIIGLAVVRPQLSYQSGIERRWSRRERFDFYYPALAHIGEQPILMKELCCGAPKPYTIAGDVIDDNSAFGYQEAWAEYRYKPSQITGKMRSGINDSLDAYHYGEYYQTPKSDIIEDVPYPFLDGTFLSQDSKTVDRSLALSSTIEPQFFGDFAFNFNVSRTMPIHSIPGLVDHY